MERSWLGGDLRVLPDDFLSPFEDQELPGRSSGILWKVKETLGSPRFLASGFLER
jgi:hypothetical protein